MKPTPARAVLAAVLVSACMGALTACAEEHREIRTRCDGPNMIYEAWVDEPGDIGLEFRELYVVANDPRCVPASPTPTTTSQPTTPQPTTS